MNERSLNGLMRSWQRLNSSDSFIRLGSGALIANTPEAALDVLANGEEIYERSSGFFRTTNHNPIPSTELAVLATSVKRLLRGFTAPTPDEIVDYFRQRPTLWTQDFGPAFVFWYFGDLMGLSRSSELELAAKNYYDRLIIRASIRGSLPSSRHRDFEVERKRAGKALSDIPRRGGPPADIVDVVLLVQDKFPADEMGELYLRLLLALVGFTGIAFEWLILAWQEIPKDAGDYTREESSALFVATQVAYPTAWRLLRTARMHTTAARQGDTVLIPTFKFHSPHSPSREAFDLKTGSENSTLFAPFGRGAGACPAAGYAQDMLIDTALLVGQRFTITARKDYFRRPHVLSLLSPRRQKVVLGEL